MESQAAFILKVLVLSAVLSVLIKYGGPFLKVSPTPLLLLMLVFLPSAILALTLLGRLGQQ